MPWLQSLTQFWRGDDPAQRQTQGKVVSPQISVVIPVHNHERFIGEAVESVVRQTYRDIELIVVDDGSTDSTWTVLSHLGGLPIPHRWVQQAHAGTAVALNTGISLAKGRFIAWLSSDDMFVENKLEREKEFMDAHPDLALIYTDVMVKDETTHRDYFLPSAAFSEHDRMVAELFRYCFINGSTTLIRKEAIEAVGGFEPSLIQAHDWDLWLRLSRDFRFGHIAEPLLYYRWHGTNLSVREDALAYHGRVLERARAWYAAAGITPPV